MRIVLPYNVKKAYLMMLLALGLTPTFTSCEKDDPKPYDPVAEQLKALRADSTRLAGEVRAAVLPAKTVDYNITTFFNQIFSAYANEDGNPKNLPDSSNLFIKTVDNIRSFAPDVNGPTLDSLKSKSNSYLSTIDTMDRLLGRTSR